MTNRTFGNYREPVSYYAEATSYIDAMDYIDFMSDDGWRVLVKPFVVRVERIAIHKAGTTEWLETPVEWGFVLHKFHEMNIL